MKALLHDRPTLSVLAIGLIACAIVQVVLGAPATPSAVLGASIATLNWLSLRWIVRQLMRARKLAYVGLLFTKFVALLVGVGLLVGFDLVHPVGFLSGLSALMLGIGVSASHLLDSGFSGDESGAGGQAPAPDAAGQERPHHASGELSKPRPSLAPDAE